LEYFLQQLINGVTLGAIYGLIAIGYTMVYGVVGMINFAHGEIYMVGAFIAAIAFMVLQALGIASVSILFAVALPVTVILTACYGFAVERIAYRPLRGASKLAPIISAIGMSIFLQNFIQITQGARVRPVRLNLQGGITLLERAGFAVQISRMQLAIIATTVILVTAFAFLIGRTSIGRAQRACAQDQTMVALLGINVDRVIAMTFVMGAALAAVAGLMVSSYYGVVDFSMGFLAGMKAFTAAVLGGIGSLPGAVLGGLLIGVIEALWSAYMSIQYKDVAVFAILIAVLTLRPAGLLGRAEIEKI
jgi:branched-chain amino acid transport system permease protein